jgi:simple sugar transport system ATP-binding protein
MKTSKVPVRNNVLTTSFSGGQLQRILLTRELAENCSLLILSDPGRGLDRLYKKKLAALLKEKTAAGTAILIFSTDIDELFALSDSITVLRNGVFSDTLELNGTTSFSAVQDRIRKAMVGQV